VELKDFIEHVIVDIAEGITAARDRVGDKIAVNPASVNGESVVEKDYINFDIALTASETLGQSKDKSVKGRLKIYVVEMGAKKTESTSQNLGSEKISRTSFKVPVYYGATFKKKDLA
jgi:hypothetical protein